jgi:hypothetical protein
VVAGSGFFQPAAEAQLEAKMGLRTLDADTIYRCILSVMYTLGRMCLNARDGRRRY